MKDTRAIPEDVRELLTKQQDSREQSRGRDDGTKEGEAPKVAKTDSRTFSGSSDEED